MGRTVIDGQNRQSMLCCNAPTNQPVGVMEGHERSDQIELLGEEGTRWIDGWMDGWMARGELREWIC